MTPRVDRRSIVTSGHTTQEVDRIINTYVFGVKDQQIMRDLFLGGLTYDQVAAKQDMSLRGLQYRVKRNFTSIKDHLN